MKTVIALSTFPPTRCGLATFAEDLAEAIRATGSVQMVPAPIFTGCGSTPWPGLSRDEPLSYVRLADFINDSPSVDGVLVQHEYGLYGGRYGENLLPFLTAVRRPVTTVLHTTLPRPRDPYLRLLTQEVAGRSDGLVVMCQAAKAVLVADYGVPPDNVTVIPHGYRPLAVAPSSWSTLTHRPARPAPFLLSIGLLGPNKGVEIAIRALPYVLAEYPHAHYFIVGTSHPRGSDATGRSYVALLKRLVEDTGVGHAVDFVDRYVSRDEYLSWLLAADLVLMPCRELRQVSSGTLAHALGMQRVVISSRSLVAAEVVGDSRGALLDELSPDCLATAILNLWSSPDRRAQIMEACRSLAEATPWDVIACSYRDVIEGRALSPSLMS